MEIPLNAEVRTKEGPVGRSTRLILNPLNEIVTHVVVKPSGMGEAEYMTPIDLIAESTSEYIQLDCRQSQFFLLEKLDTWRFLDTDKYGISPEDPGALPESEPAMNPVFWPFVTAEGDTGSFVEVEHIPAGELDVRWGSHVEATNGRVGRVDEFLVNPDNGHITHLVLRKGHLWGEKDVAVPVSDIDRLEGGVVYLKLDKAAVKDLPAVSVKRS
jgi:sporulation protein YlmC with PRC-barrel domain